MRLAPKNRALVAVVAVGALLVGTPAAFARSLHVAGIYLSTGGGCPAPATHPDTRLGRIATANTYLRSLVTHDTSDLQVANDVVRTEEGGVTANGAKEICKGNQGPVTIEDAVLGMREIRWVVSDGDQAIAFYLLDSPTSPTYIAERFQVDHGLIQHIEAIFYIDTTGLAVGPESVASRPGGVTERAFGSDDGPVGFFAPANHQGDVSEPSPAVRTTVQAAAQAYLDALVSHHAAAVPLTPKARRIENRRHHGDNAAQIRADLQSGANKVTGLSDLRIWVEGDQAVAITRSSRRRSIGSVSSVATSGQRRGSASTTVGSRRSRASARPAPCAAPRRAADGWQSASAGSFLTCGTWPRSRRRTRPPA